jgi:hypothetical protein
MRPWILAFLLIPGPAMHATFELSHPSGIGPVSHAQRPLIASNGRGYLTVWADTRPGRLSEVGARAMLLDPQGRPRIARDFELVSPPRLGIPAGWGPAQPALASNGRDYLFAYSPYLDGSFTNFVRVTDEGAIELMPHAVEGTLEAMVAWGSYYAVIVKDGHGKHLLLIDDRGEVVRRLGPTVLTSQDSVQLQATSDGRLLLLMHPWEGEDASVAFLTLEEFFDPAFQLLNVRSTFHSERRKISIAESNGRFLIVSPTFGRLSLVLLDRKGDVMLSETRPAPELQYSSTLVARRIGSGFVVIASSALVGVANGAESVAALRLSADLVPATADFEHLSFESRQDVADAVVADGGVTVAYVNRNGTGTDFQAVRVQHLSVSGKKTFGLDGAVASMNLPSQEQAVVAQCGTVHAAAWLDSWADRTQVHLRRFLADGTPLDPANRRVDSSERAVLSDVTVTCGRSSMLVSWWDHSADNRQLAFIPIVGNDAVRLATLTGKDGASVFDGEHFVVFGGGIDGKLLTRWTEDGERIEERELSSDGFSDNAALSWSGDHFYAAWEERQGSRRRLVARRLDLDFNAAGPNLELALSNGNSITFETLRVASDSAGGALVAWGLCSSVECNAFTSRIDEDGVLVDAPGGQRRGRLIPRPIASSFHLPFDLHFNGSAFELLTEEGLRTIAPEGRSVMRRFALGAQEFPAALTATGDRRLLISWQRDAVSGMKRLFGAWVDGTSWTVPPSQRRRSASH